MFVELDIACIVTPEDIRIEAYLFVIGCVESKQDSDKVLGLFVDVGSLTSNDARSIEHEQPYLFLGEYDRVNKS